MSSADRPEIGSRLWHTRYGWVEVVAPDPDELPNEVTVRIETDGLRATVRRGSFLDGPAPDAGTS